MDDSGLGCAERWEIDHWSRVEGKYLVSCAAKPGKRRCCERQETERGGREVRGKEGKEIRGKATDDEHILARIPNFQIPKSLPGFPSHSP